MRKKKGYRKPGINGEEFFTLIAGLMAIIVIISVIASWNDMLFFPGTVTAKGIIASCQIEHNKLESSCKATIGYDTQSGQHMTFSTFTSDFTVGDTIAIRYHPNSPGDARVDNTFSDFAFTAFTLGLLLVELCIFIYWKRRTDREYRRIHKGFAKSTRRPDKRQKECLAMEEDK